MESKTGKIVAAVLMTVLMLVFLLPAGIGQMTGGDLADQALADLKVLRQPSRRHAGPSRPD